MPYASILLSFNFIVSIVEFLAHILIIVCAISTTRLTGGLLYGYKPLLPASA